MQLNEGIKDTKDCDFWQIIPQKKGKPIVNILTEKLIDFCSKVLGFYNYVDYSGNFILVKVTKTSIIEESTVKHLKHSIKNYLRNIKKEEGVYSEFAQRNYLTQNTLDLIEKLSEVNFNLSGENEALFFYQNGVVSISKEKFKLIPYVDFKGAVWKEQIIKRDFIPHTLKYNTCVFNRFLINICGNNVKRYNSLISILGYLLHPYKDPSVAKAVILLDERIDFSGTANGGTGKSLIAKALEQITQTVFKDGKKYNSNEVFVFDDIRPYHRLLYFDDVKATFKLDEFFSSITGDLRINRKYKDSLLIPAKFSPKILITSNYMVRGTGGETDERRRIEFEIAPHYSLKFSPKDEFGHLFFQDWEAEEWLLFDSLLLSAVRYYISNGIINPPQINLKENKLKVLTDHEFVIFMAGNIEFDTTYDKAVLLDEFRKLCPSQRTLSAILFKRWIDLWVESHGYAAHHFKSNGKANLIISKKDF